MNLFELFVKIGVDDKASPAMKNTQKNSETLTNKIKVMSAQFEEAQKNVDKLTKEFNDSVEKTGATSKETQELAKKLDNAEKEAEQAKKALDGYNSEIEETGTKSEKAGAGLSNFASKLGKGIATAAKIGAAAVGAAATGISALTAASVKSYAEYEQLVGGVETIFGARGKSLEEYAASVNKTVEEAQEEYAALMKSQQAVIDNADRAYQTAGLSANEYMQAVTSFSASLLQSLNGDTQKAAEYADRALIDMSDNVNKYGSNMADVQNAYQGFAKQNYTMLDNLKLGYGGTQEEMKRLVADASKMTEVQEKLGLTVDASSLSFGNIVNAISVMQEKMGIAGTTASEASTTISGSIAQMKAQWKNLITSLSGEGLDTGVYMENFVDSVKTVVNNLAPTIGTALNGVGQLIQSVTPVIMDYIPQIIGEFLPKIAESAVGIVTSIGTAIFDNIDQVLEYGQEMLDTLLEGINANSDGISGVVSELIVKFGTFVFDNLPEIITAGINILGALISGIVQAIPELATAATRAVIALCSYIIDPENLLKVINVAFDIMHAFDEGMDNAKDVLIEAGKRVIANIKQGISDAWNGLVSWFNGLWDSLFSNRSVSVSADVSTNGSHAGGLAYVPFDGYIAELHKGERVLTASEARAYNDGYGTGGSGGITVVQNIQSVPMTPVELSATTKAYWQRARWAF